MVNLNQLRAFYYVAKHDSYTVAAQKLFITQPAVTAQIKLFENFYGIKLFNRKGRALFLSHIGKLLFEKAEKIFALENEIEEMLAQMKEMNQGLLAIGCTKAYAKHIMPSIISAFHRTYPNIRIILEEGSSMAMINSLRDFENEIIVVAQMDIKDSRIQFIPFSQEEIVLIMAVDHPLSKKKEVTFNDIKNEPIILKGTGSGTRKKIVDLYRNNDMVPIVFMESNNTEFIINLVEKGEGISFLVKPSIEQKVYEKKIVMHRLKDNRLFLDVSLGFSKNNPLSPAASAFYEVIKRTFTEEFSQNKIGSIMAKILAGKFVKD
ncbi:MULTISPECIES: LysR family transcriptional regulator [Desulfotignum]|jgi:DNA-binding transcriptional LysR family regulator|uniref:HTH-type transcriptional regulator, LysR family n=1 Tax=Desulfotignum phosphitoxidans DSM 13687 TaxID=1286635 RepID=S0FYA3_9BACT|nr:MULTISPECIES: LysR family transcriptional regulator [Desulfotignum]EMS80058.1 HTH-type transcriptional regulator, LysR family [Desulfotignum phosphitoxidans DSM 13687]